METKLLAEKIKEIQMPKEMEKRILERCNENMVADKKKEMEMKHMRKNKVRWNKSLVMAASLAVCICITGVTAMAASGQLKGFFKDKIGWNGAVVGSTYEQATDEIQVSVVKADVEDELELLVTFVNPETVPYRVLDMICIETYQILNEAGSVVAEGVMEEYELMAEAVNMTIPVELLGEGSYKLVITAFSGASKADQPLSIYGEWECEFVK